MQFLMQTLELETKKNHNCFNNEINKIGNKENKTH